MKDYDVHVASCLLVDAVMDLDDKQLESLEKLVVGGERDGITAGFCVMMLGAMQEAKRKKANRQRFSRHMWGEPFGVNVNLRG